MQNELLPCPFCGSTDVFAERKDLSETVIMCNNCCVFGPGGQPEDDEDLEIEDREDLLPGELMARRRWNERKLLNLPKARGASVDAESPNRTGVLIMFERELTSEELRNLHSMLD